MGTHIDCIIPKEKEDSAAEIKRKLKDVFKQLKPHYLQLEKYGTFTHKVEGDWTITNVPGEKENPGYIIGEGDHFDIEVYENVVCIGCVERFSSLYLSEGNLSQSLFEIITGLSNVFRSSNELLIGAGGHGETDSIMDMAHTQNASFEEICNEMTALNGTPAATLNQLIDKSWLLKKN